MKIFNHVQIKVKDLKISRRFYNPIIKILGYQVVLESKDIVIGYGTSLHDMFEIRQHDGKFPLSQFVHLAFNAPNRESVDAFYHKAIANGATGNGEPGFRPEYEKGYYAALIQMVIILKRFIMKNRNFTNIRKLK